MRRVGAVATPPHAHTHTHTHTHAEKQPHTIDPDNNAHMHARARAPLSSHFIFFLPPQNNLSLRWLNDGKNTQRAEFLQVVVAARFRRLGPPSSGCLQRCCRRFKIKGGVSAGRERAQNTAPRKKKREPPPPTTHRSARVSFLRLSLSLALHLRCCVEKKAAKKSLGCCLPLLLLCCCLCETKTCIHHQPSSVVTSIAVIARASSSRCALLTTL